ncbi:MAG: branched-chain amino acid ABC transporter substrate-binding protein [Solirubrobacterales bacterium]
MPSRSWASRAALALAALAATAAGCDTGGEGAGENEFVTVYVSTPLAGPSGADGRDVADGARLALADAGRRAGVLEVRAEYLDGAEGEGDHAGWSPARAAANARGAIHDSTAIAYIGDFESGATRASLPVTNEARMLQVSPASSAINLVAPFQGTDELPEVQSSDERTFGRVIPGDDVQAEAAARWANRLGGRRALIASDGSAYGDQMTETFAGSARELGMRTSRLATPSGISCPAGALAYVAAQPGANRGLFFAPADVRALADPATLRRGLPQPRPAASGNAVITTDAILTERPNLGIRRCEPALRIVSGAVDPAQLAPAGRRFARRFASEYERRPGRYAAYGYEAMAVVLDSIERAGDRGAEREAVVEAFFETADRDSVLGAYSIDEVGETTLERMTGYRLDGSRLRPAAELTPP